MKWLVARFYYAFCGLKYIIQDRSIRLQCIFALLVIILSFLFHCTMTEWLWILLAITLIVVGETFNSCIEKCVDYISLKRDSRAKQIKDMAAGAMFILFLFSLVVGISIFLPKVIDLLS